MTGETKMKWNPDWEKVHKAGGDLITIGVAVNNQTENGHQIVRRIEKRENCIVKQARKQINQLTDDNEYLKEKLAVNKAIVESKENSIVELERRLQRLKVKK